MKQRKYTAVAVAALAGFVALTVAAIAHEGHGEPMMGTIAKIDEGRLWLTPEGDEAASFALTGDTVFERGGQEVGRDEVRTGQRAVVRYEEHDGHGVAYQVSLPPAEKTSGTSAALQPVEHRFVCMVNDKVFERQMIPVEVDGRTYYGCCPMCEARLSDDPEVRTAVDPVTGNPVDKATAVIAAGPDGTVLYFESEATLARFAAQANER